MWETAAIIAAFLFLLLLASILMPDGLEQDAKYEAEEDSYWHDDNWWHHDKTKTEPSSRDSQRDK